VTKSPALPLAALTLAVHLAVGSGYGYFRDELYFIVCGLNPDWGYVDQPPLVPLLAGLMHLLFPSSLVMLRLIPALGHAATVALTAETARLLGGEKWAQILAGLSVLGSGVYLAFGTIFTTDAFQPLSWLFCGYALIRLIREGEERWWLAIGAVAGVSFLSKYMIAFWLAALGLGLLATPARRSLARPYLYLGAALCLIIVLPNVLWQWNHDWPFMEIGRHAAEGKNLELSPWDFALAVGRQLDWAATPVWLAGLVAFAVWRRFADLRLFAIAFAALMAAMVAMHAKPYYPAGAFPLLFAGGAVALEAFVLSAVLRWAFTAAITFFAIIAAPFAVPILPVERFAAYQAFLNQTPQAMEHQELGRLPQYYADMFGWPELAALVGRAFASLPPEERARAVFLANNYGEAGAIDVLGRDWDLPQAIAAHNNYFLWGPRGHDGSVVIRLGGTREALLKTYATVEAFAIFEHPWAMPYETGKTLWICRGRKQTLEAGWAGMRSYN
jgi:hypothetical protein